jgi:hypothetical protein
MAKKSVKGPSKAVSNGRSKAMTFSDISEDEIDKCTVFILTCSI